MALPNFARAAWFGAIPEASEVTRKMASPEHLEILKQDVGRWNKWRKERPGVEPDLSGADLNGAYLHGADLKRANLIQTRLSRADLGEAFLWQAVLAAADLSQADLRKAYLEDATLSPANLFDANLDGATLTRADVLAANLGSASLIRADLCEANFSAANLAGVNLEGANLGMASFVRSNLGDANLRGTNVTGTNFSGADLIGTDFGEAKAWNTMFADVDLSDTKGLDAVQHGGPSTIGIDTICRSGSKIPEPFLRGCGLQDWEIQMVKLYHPDLGPGELTNILYRVSELRSGAPVRYSSCFISYSTKDQEVADRLYNDLQGHGVRCWFAPHDIKGGRKIHEQIDEAIRLHDKLLLILSQHSMSSEWVNTEIAKARKREIKEGKRVLFPVRLVGFEALRDWECFDVDAAKDSAREIREYFIPDFSNWKNHDSYQTAFQRLVKDLKAEAGK